MRIFGIGDVFLLRCYFLLQILFLFTQIIIYYRIVTQNILMSLFTLDLPTTFPFGAKAYVHGL